MGAPGKQHEAQDSVQQEILNVHDVEIGQDLNGRLSAERRTDKEQNGAENNGKKHESDLMRQPENFFIQKAQYRYQACYDHDKG